jgi:hypothetical protein
MRKTAPSRRVIALVAAYVVALQALLLPLSVAAGPVIGDTRCSASAGQTQSPAGSDTGCPCAAGCGMQCCAQSLAGSPQVSVAISPTFAWVSMPASVLEPVVRLAKMRPQAPRAPPADR